MRSDSPPASWYEPADPDDDDDPAPDWPPEALHVLAGCVIWQCAPLDHDD